MLYAQWWTSLCPILYILVFQINRHIPNVSGLILQNFVFAQTIEARCQVENEDVVGASRTGDAPTTSQWSTILLPTNYIRGLTVQWEVLQFDT